MASGPSTRRFVQHPGGMNPLGDVEPSDEVRPVGHGDRARPEQPLQGAFSHVVPPPGSAGLPRLAQVGNPKGSLFSHLPAHLLYVFGVVVVDGLDPSPRRFTHPVDEEGAIADRHQGSLVPPVLEEVPGCPQPLVEKITGIGAQPGEEREVMCPGQHVDRVQLHDTHMSEDTPVVVGAHLLRGARPPEPRGGDRQPAGLGQGQSLHDRSRRDPGCPASRVSGHIRQEPMVVSVAFSLFVAGAPGTGR